MRAGEASGTGRGIKKNEGLCQGLFSLSLSHLGGHNPILGGNKLGVLKDRTGSWLNFLKFPDVAQGPLGPG